MGTSWIKRHKHEQEGNGRIERDKKRYEEWKAQFCTYNGSTLRWNEDKISRWMEQRRALSISHEEEEE